jgi:hypothetical protein
VNQSANSVTSADPKTRRILLNDARFWRLQLEPSVRAVAVVVDEVLTNDGLQVSSAEYQDPVEALSPQRSDEALGEGVGASRQQHLIPTIKVALSV